MLKGGSGLTFRGKIFDFTRGTIIRTRSRHIIPGTDLIGQLANQWIQLASAVLWNVNNEGWAAAIRGITAGLLSQNNTIALAKKIAIHFDFLQYHS